MNREEMFLKVASALVEAGVEQKIKMVKEDTEEPRFVAIRAGEIDWLYDLDELAGDYEMWLEKRVPEGVTDDWLIVELFKYAVNDYATVIVESLIALHAYQKVYSNGHDIFEAYGITGIDPEVLKDIVVRNIESKILKEGKWQNVD